MKNNTYVAIMAGGVGSRFWPASRTAKPKQFLDILGIGSSLLQMTYNRFLALCPPENILVVTNAIYKELVQEQIPGIPPGNILCEPSRNNTAPCIAYTAFKLDALNPEANLIIAPSDHLILNNDLFIRNLKAALALTAKEDAIVTLGIQPQSPHTGYGYIQFEPSGSGPADPSVHPVLRFTEKPDAETARSFLASGGYLWNAGIFIWSVRTILKAFQQHSPDIYTMLAAGKGLYNTEKEEAFIKDVYPDTPNISVDYAILERAKNVYTIPSDFGWSDLGSWGALYDETEKDPFGNVLTSDDVLLYNVTDSLIRAPAGKLVILKDLHDYIVVDEEDVLLVFPKAKEQEIKKVTAEIQKSIGDKLL